VSLSGISKTKIDKIRQNEVAGRDVVSGEKNVLLGARHLNALTQILTELGSLSLTEMLWCGSYSPPGRPAVGTKDPLRASSLYFPLVPNAYKLRQHLQSTTPLTDLFNEQYNLTGSRGQDSGLHRGPTYQRELDGFDSEFTGAL